MISKKKISQRKDQGSNSDYKPFISVHDFPSYGQANRVLGWKTGRHHELFSQLELFYFYLLDWSIKVIDIQEQYPLQPLEETLLIASQCGVRHPYNKINKQAINLTTDFFITVSTPEGIIKVARTVKPTDHLQKLRTIEKLEIERRYYEAREIDFGIVTEKEIDTIFAKNIEWVHNYHSISSLNPLKQQFIHKVSKLLTKEITNSALSLREIALKCDDQLGLEIGTCLSVVRHMIATRQWKVDMSVPIQTAQKLNLLGLDLRP